MLQTADFTLSVVYITWLSTLPNGMQRNLLEIHCCIELRDIVKDPRWPDLGGGATDFESCILCSSRIYDGTQIWNGFLKLLDYVNEQSTSLSCVRISTYDGFDI
jgi:hypothetical protein